MENANSITISANEVKILKNDITNLGAKISSIESKINKLLGTKVGGCDHDCVLCAMVWFCAKEWELKDVCGRHLEKIILVYALTKKIEINYYTQTEINEIIECSGLMKVLAACQIVARADPQYEFPPKSEERARNNTIDEAWKQLITIGQSERYVMLGRMPYEIHIERSVPVVGHIEVCNLKRVAHGEIEIYDPQKTQEGLKKDQAGFHEHVKDDAGLQIYTVEWEEVKQMIEWYGKIKSHCKHD